VTATPPGLPGFLLARLDEDEAAARASAEVNPPPWSAEVWQDELTGLVVGGKTKANRYLDGALWDNEGAQSLSMEPPTAVHIARHDPARVLADCKAIRAIVALYRRAVAEQVLGEPKTVLALGVVLMHLSAEFADHPSYRPEWTPPA
jgi:hypothetical protein